MSEPSIIFNEVNERQGVFTRRVFLLGGLTGAGLGVLSGRLAQLQLVQNKGYLEQAKDNQYRTNLIIPPRGVILDRNNVTLASNRPNFRVMLTPASTPNVDEALAAICAVLGLSDARREELKAQIVHSPKYRPIEIAEDLTWEQFSAVNVRAPELPGVTASMGEARVYPFGGAFAHVIGYVHTADKKDLQQPGIKADELTLNPAYRIGKTGIEKALEVQLRGRPGAEMDEVDVRGRVIARRADEDIAPTPGAQVVLTLDADIQNRAMEVFGEESGAAVMMDCRTGDLLCLASAPSFDANSFVKGVPSREYNALMNYERKPLLNKAIYGNFPPGSTFKMTVALAALEKGIPETTTHVCGGAWPYGGHTWHCDKAHGSLNMHDAIKVSCDIYFYQTALAVGPELIAQTARKLGLGGVFDIGISGQKAGLVPDPTWKAEYFRTRRPSEMKWYPGDTISYGIGQGMLTVNALEQCVMVSRLANAKKALAPRLIRSVGGVEQPSGAAVPDLPFPAEHLDFIRAAMASVANDAGGTAAGAAKLDLGPIKMAGKTGTAQAQNYAGGSRATLHLDWAKRDHAWFVAFAPYDDPRYALAVIVQHGGWGASAAAPKAREIMRVALLKDPEVRERIRNPASFVDTRGISAKAAVSTTADTESIESPPLPEAVPQVDQ